MARVILCTGIDGEAKQKRIQEIIDSTTQFYLSAKIYLYSVGDEMSKEYERSKSHKISKEELLDLPELEQKLLRKSTCERIFEDFQVKAKSSWDVACVLTRATYFHKGKFWPTLDESHDILNPEFCVSLIDDIQIMHENMRKDPRWRDMELQRLLDWRDDEYDKTKQKYCSYLLAVREPPQTLLDLLFSKKKKAYLSFPITHASPQIKAKKERFVERLREHFVVFDPSSIQEYDKALKEGSFPARIKDLGDKTVLRDYDLIERCDCLIVYYPTSKIYVEDPDGEAVIKLGNSQEVKAKESEGVFLSAGVISEMERADKRPHIKTYAIWESGKPPSPFFSTKCDTIFSSEGEFWGKVSSLA